MYKPTQKRDHRGRWSTGRGVVRAVIPGIVARAAIPAAVAGLATVGAAALNGQFARTGPPGHIDVGHHLSPRRGYIDHGTYRG